MALAALQMHFELSDSQPELATQLSTQLGNEKVEVAPTLLASEAARNRSAALLRACRVGRSIVAGLRVVQALKRILDPGGGVDSRTDRQNTLLATSAIEEHVLLSRHLVPKGVPEAEVEEEILGGAES